MSACNSVTESNKTENPAKAAEEQNDQKFSKADEKDAQFVVDVVAGNYDEIKLANYAQQKSMNDEIKMMAKKMEQDHTNAVNSLKNIASAKSISVPEPDTTAADRKMKNWNDKKPADFDKEWTDEMIDMHKKTIDKLESRQKDTQDTEIKSWIDATLPTVRAHLDMLNQCKEKLK